MIDEKPVPPTSESAEGSLPTPPVDAALAVEESLRKAKARRFRKGDRVRGRVVRFTDHMAFVDLGEQQEGLIDLDDVRRADGSIDLEENQEVEGIVIDVAANGVLLRRALVSAEESLAQLRAAQAAGISVQANVIGVNKGGLELELFGLRAFCPASQVDVRKVDDLTGLVGQTLEFRIGEVSDDGRKIVLSRRALLQDEYDRQIAELRARLQPGATVTGTVVRVQPFGAFIDLGGIEGLCHVSELTRARIQHPADVVKAGDRVEVQVVKVEETTDKNGKKVERIALSRRALEQDPWETVAERFPAGQKVTGRVVRLQPFGAFIEVAPGIEGLAHVSTISDKRIDHPKDVLNEGDTVEVYVLQAEPQKKRLSLSVREPRAAQPKAAAGKPAGQPRREPRAPRPAPQQQAEGAPRYEKGSVHEATVEKVEPFGVFITLPGGGRALVPNAELGIQKNADQKIDYRKYFTAGQAVRVAITGTDQRGNLRASRVEAERADERAMVREWSQTQKAPSGGAGFGTFADLLRKANIVK